MTRTRIGILLCAVLMAWAASDALAVTYQTLRIARPVATSASAASGLDSANRIYRAYTGIPYEIHADAVGGKWPYTYSLSGAPSGMTISAGPCTDIGPTGCTAGTITWPSPTAGTTSPITVTITDALGTQVTGTWSITVGTTGACFIDATSGNDSTGSGTLASPWQTLGKAWTSCGAGTVLYLRAGNYTTLGMNDTENTGLDSGYRKKVALRESLRPVIWLAYPGDAQPVVDFGATGSNQVQMFDVDGSTKNLWLDGIKFTNIQCLGFRIARTDTSPYGVVIRKNWFYNLQDGYDDGNCSFVFLQSQYVNSGIGPSYFDTIQNNIFEYVHGDGGAADPDCCGGSVLPTDNADAIKLYSTYYLLMEHNRAKTSALNAEILNTKTENYSITIRGNICESDGVTCWGGNLHSTPYIGGATHRKGSGTPTVNAGTDTFTLTAHGMSNGNHVSIEWIGGTAAPGGLEIWDTDYYVVGATTDTFQLSLTNGGAAIDITSAGTSPTYWITDELQATRVRTTGEIYHNLSFATGTASGTGSFVIGYARTSKIGGIQIYRNTAVGGQISIENLVTQDGPIALESNVIVNAGGSGGSCPQRLDCYSVIDYSVTTVNANNLQGANDGTIANATTGVLVGASRTTYLGVAGYELGAGTSSPVFNPTINLRRSDLDILRDDLTAFIAEQTQRWAGFCRVAAQTKTTWATRMRREIPC